jgi:hypothetical protein
MLMQVKSNSCTHLRVLYKRLCKYVSLTPERSPTPHWAKRAYTHHLIKSTYWYSLMRRRTRFRTPQATELTYALVSQEETVSDQVRLGLEKQQTGDRSKAPIWGNNCAPAVSRNTAGALCAPSKCTCKWPLVHHGPGDILAANPPHWLAGHYFYDIKEPDYLLNAKHLTQMEMKMSAQMKPKGAMKPRPPTGAKAAHIQTQTGPPPSPYARSKYAVLKAYIQRKRADRETAEKEQRLNPKMYVPRPPVEAPATMSSWGAALRLKRHPHEGRVQVCGCLSSGVLVCGSGCAGV